MGRLVDELRETAKKRKAEMTAAQAERLKQESDKIRTEALAFANALLLKCQQAAEQGRFYAEVPITCDYSSGYKLDQLMVACMAVGLHGMEITTGTGDGRNFTLNANFEEK